ncbi:hypothetical protein P885DRAFT_24682, partial [Corynascus similis CBS 632.67]
PKDAGNRLSPFRDQMLSHLPFFNLPDHMTAEHVREQKPFLLFSIMAVTARSVKAQSLMSTVIREHVARKMIVENQKSMDLLLGLLVFLGWYSAHLHASWRLHLTLMGSLAMSLVYDLCLDKSPTPPSFRLLCAPKPTAALEERTVEMRRASLACFYLTANIAQNSKRLKGLSWTAQYDEDVKLLTQKQDCKGDRVLVALVNVQ